MLAASVLPADPYFCWGGLVLLLVPLVTLQEWRLPINALSMVVAFFCILLAANAVFYTPHYSVYGIYRPVALFGGFAAVAVLNGGAQERLLRAGSKLLALLVLFGLLQVLFGFWPWEANEARAAASFATPNTFATAINLFLLPLIALALCGRGGRWVRPAAFWLFAGLLSTESRGGWVAFLAGALFVVSYLGWPKSCEERTRWLGLTVGLGGTALAYYALRVLSAVLPQMLEFGSTRGPGSLLGLVVEDMVGRGTSYRVDIAAVTLGQIAERPIAGSGAGTFWPLYEMAKPPALDIGMTFPFAHNDYLQTWLEFGLAGIVLLVALAGVALALVLRARRERRVDPVPLTAGAALAGIFAHALIDFPLYVPFPVMVFGAWLGGLAAHAGDAPWAAGWTARVRERLGPLRTPLIAGAIAVAALAWLAQPVAAYFAARHALAELFAGHPREALYWQAVARRMEPKSGMRHWEEGVIWRDQALAANDKGLASRADAIFAEGALVDPYDVNCLSERVRLHRLHANLLESAEPPAEVLAWSEQALRLRPYSVATKAEYVRTLAYAGRTDEARQSAQDLMSRYPDSALARRLAAELKMENTGTGRP